MEGNFIDFLNSFGIPLGTWLAIIIGGIAVISAIIKAVKEIKKKYDKYLVTKVNKEKEEKEFRESMLTVANNVTTIQTNIDALSKQQQNQQQEIHTKLDEVWNAIVASQKDSRDGDIALENQIKNYVTTIDNINIKLSAVDDKTNLLIDSDKEGIKSFITDKFYEAKEKGYIELHVLETLELRYKKYLQENGNTYVKKLMDTLRMLPNEPNQVRSSTSNNNK